MRKITLVFALFLISTTSSFSLGISKMEIGILKKQILKGKPQEMISFDEQRKLNKALSSILGKFDGCLFILSDRGDCSELNVTFGGANKGKEFRGYFSVALNNPRFKFKSSSATEFRDFYLINENDEVAYIRIGEKVLLQFIHHYTNKKVILGNGYWDDGKRFEYLGHFKLEKK